MAESLNLTSEDDDDDLTTEKDKKKSGKRSDSSVKIGASVLEKDTTRSSEVPKMSSLDKILASLLPEKDAKTKQNAKAEGIFAELGKNQPEIETPETTEELLPIRELEPYELSGGEVVIDLRAEDLEDADEGELSVASQQIDTEAAATSEPAPVEEHEDPVQITATPPSIRTGAGSGGGNRTPPPPRPTPSSPPPSRPHKPIIPLPRAAAIPAPSTTFDAMPTPAPGSTLNQILEQQRELEHAAYYGRRHGRVEGLLGGIIIGGFFENIRNRSRERRLEKQARQERQKQGKRLDNLEFQQNLLRTEQLEQARKADAERYERKAAAKHEMAVVAEAQMSEAEALKHAREMSRAAEEQERNKAALIERLNAQAAHQEKLEADNLLLNPENRIETSAWHAIEVDKTGHAVQETSIAYGHEYYRERGHESGPKDTFTRDSITGAAALTAATTAQSSQTGSSGAAASPMLGMQQAQENDRQDRAQDVQSSDGQAPSTTSAAGVVLLIITLVVVVALIIALT